MPSVSTLKASWLKSQFEGISYVPRYALRTIQATLSTTHRPTKTPVHATSQHAFTPEIQLKEYLALLSQKKPYTTHVFQQTTLIPYYLQIVPAQNTNDMLLTTILALESPIFTPQTLALFLFFGSPGFLVLVNDIADSQLQLNVYNLHIAIS
jgi:hypothetical protein